MVKSYMPRRKERERHCFRKKDHVREKEVSKIGLKGRERERH